MADNVDTPSAPCPFEGPEKLLEIWFAPSPAHVPDAATAEPTKSGLRAVSRRVWEDMLDIVKCKVLSVVRGVEMDAYLLSESSLFISPHRLILKTCGTTLNLLGLPRILAIARSHAKMPKVYRCFYSRKAFMFPERQSGPHRDWALEVEFLDRIFDNGSAYTIGKMNGDHWLLYITGVDGFSSSSGTEWGSPTLSVSSLPDEKLPSTPYEDIRAFPLVPPTQDYTIEILMTHLSPHARSAFFNPVLGGDEEETLSPGSYAQLLSSRLGISDIFPRHLTQLDAYAFDPCGYSSNALLKWGNEMQGGEGEGYYTIHVTPEEGWSYASFECNVPLPHASVDDASSRKIPDLQTLIRRVVQIFEPGKLTLTLFISAADNTSAEDDEGETAVEQAQRAFKAALTRPSSALVNANGLYKTSQLGGDTALHGTGEHASSPPLYRRTDKINYEFGGYDLAFASFELKRE